MLKIHADGTLTFVMNLLAMQSHGLKHALSALISVIASTPEGIQYVTQTG